MIEMSGALVEQMRYHRVGKGDDSGASVVNWGGTSRKKMNEFVTADAFHALAAAGRLNIRHL